MEAGDDDAAREADGERICEQMEKKESLGGEM
jgi:hypothetical protein